MLEKQIKKALLETKDNKEKQVIQEGIIKSRILMIMESEDNIENFNLLSEEKQQKIAYKLLEEISFLSESGVLNEQLFDSLSKIFGSSISGILQTIAEPFVDKLLTKYLGLSGYFKEFMVSFLTKDPMRLAKAFKDCNELTKLVAESLSESVFLMLQNNTGMKGQGYSFIRNALGDVITGNEFVATLENSLGKIVCSAYHDMSGKASQVVNKLKPGVEGLTSQLTK